MEEAGQIVQVSVEGFKFIFEATAQSIETMKKVLSLVQISAKMTKDLWKGTLETGANMIKLPFKAAKGVNDLKYVKNSGKTNKDNFNLRKDSTGQFLKLEKSAAKDFEKYAKKSGILYVKMRGLDKDSKTVHYLFQSSDAPMINSFLTDVLQNGYRKKALEEVKAKYKGKSKKEILQEMAEDITVEKMKDNTFETPEEYGISENFDKMTYKEFQEKVREAFPEYEDMINEVFSGYESKAENAIETGEKTESVINEARKSDKEITLSEHIKEIQKAINNNELHKNVNRGNMVYTEINVEKIIGENKEKGTVKVSGGLTSAGKRMRVTSEIPKKSMVKVDSDSYVFVMNKDDMIPVNKEVGDNGEIKKENIYAEKFKEAFNKTTISQGGNVFVYSEKFRKMFTMKKNAKRVEVNPKDAKAKTENIKAKTENVKANTGGRSRK